MVEIDYIVENSLDDYLREALVKRLLDFKGYSSSDLTGGMVNCLKEYKSGNRFTKRSDYEFLEESLREWIDA